LFFKLLKINMKNELMFPLPLGEGLLSFPLPEGEGRVRAGPEAQQSRFAIVKMILKQDVLAPASPSHCPSPTGRGSFTAFVETSCLKTMGWQDTPPGHTKNVAFFPQF
jgi:hypothetical protein